MTEENLIEIDMVVSGPKDIDEFLHEFIKWAESKGYIVAGKVNYFNEKD